MFLVPMEHKEIKLERSFSFSYTVLLLFYKNISVTNVKISMNRFTQIYQKNGKIYLWRFIILYKSEFEYLSRICNNYVKDRMIKY